MGFDEPAIQAGSGDGDGNDGNLICWMGTPWDGDGMAGNEVVAVPS